MQNKPNQVRCERGAMLERAIILQLLRDDHDEKWSRADLEHEIADFDSLVIGDALRRLEEEGVVHLSVDLAWASKAARWLDALEMISI
jgi:hypothetical protein